MSINQIGGSGKRLLPFVRALTNILPAQFARIEFQRVLKLFQSSSLKNGIFAKRYHFKHFMLSFLVGSEFNVWLTRLFLSSLCVCVACMCYLYAAFLRNEFSSSVHELWTHWNSLFHWSWTEPAIAWIQLQTTEICLKRISPERVESEVIRAVTGEDTSRIVQWNTIEDYFNQSSTLAIFLSFLCLFCVLFWPTFSIILTVHHPG